MGKSDLDTIADQIILDLDLRDRVQTASLQDLELEIIDKVLAHYVAEGLKDIDCYAIDEGSGETPEAIEIVQKVWERLREIHRLRVVE